MSAVTVYQNRLKAIRLATSRAVAVEWDRLPDMNKPQAEPFAARVTPIVKAGQLLAARTTVAHISRQARITPIRIDPNTVTGQAARNIDPIEEYQRPFGAVWSALSGGADIEQATAAGRSRLGILAVTDVWLATRAAAAVIDDATPKIIGWVRVADAGACDLCSAADGMPMSAAADMAGHPECFLGDALVSADAKLAYRRRYAGEVVIVTTASGQKLTATSNHPILTDKGWVPAHLLSEGDDVVRCAVEHRSPNEQHRPARIEDVWRAGRVAGLRRMPLASEDFHADGAYGEVEIVDTNRLLRDEGNPAFAQVLHRGQLVHGWHRRDSLSRRCPFHSFGGGGFPSGSRLVGSRGLGSPAFATNRLHLALGVLAGRPGRHSALESSVNRSASDPQPLRHRQNALAVLVRGDHLADIQVMPPVPRFDAPAMQFSDDNRGAYAEIGLDLLRRLAGQIELDRIVKVRTSTFTGHVFNLETVEGWYWTNSLAVSNCGCSSEPQLSDSPESAAADPEATDVHEHNELGPVLYEAGQSFARP